MFFSLTGFCGRISPISRKMIDNRTLEISLSEHSMLRILEPGYELSKHTVNPDLQMYIFVFVRCENTLGLQNA